MGIILSLGFCLPLSTMLLVLHIWLLSLHAVVNNQLESIDQNCCIRNLTVNCNFVYGLGDTMKWFHKEVSSLENWTQYRIGTRPP